MALDLTDVLKQDLQLQVNHLVYIYFMFMSLRPLNMSLICTRV